jgi:hypothetical protein
VSAPCLAVRIDVIVYNDPQVGEKNLDGDLTTSLINAAREIPNCAITDLKAPLFAAARRADKGDDNISAFMALPELIPESSALRSLTKADVLLVISVNAYYEEDGVRYIEMEASAWDARGSAKRRDIGVVDLREKADKPTFLSHAAREIFDALGSEIPDVVPELAKLHSVEEVVTNEVSRVYHTPSCNHVPRKSKKLRRDQADAAKYRPCTICFPPRGQSLPNGKLEVSIAKQLGGDIEYSYRVKNDETLGGWVRTVGDRIVTRCELTKRRYTFILLDSEEYNAFAAGAGYIYITSGTLDAVESDDELAFMLARQIAHTELQHPVLEYRRGRTMSQITKVVGWVTGRDLSDLADFTKKIINRGYSREYELEADRLAVIYAKRAGFDPQEAFTVIGKVKDMENESSSRISQFMNSHPKPDDRIAALKEAEKQDEEARKYIQSLRDVDAGLYTALKDDDTAALRIKEIREFADASKRVAVQ